MSSVQQLFVLKLNENNEFSSRILCPHCELYDMYDGNEMCYRCNKTEEKKANVLAMKTIRKNNTKRKAHLQNKRKWQDICNSNKKYQSIENDEALLIVDLIALHKEGAITLKQLHENAGPKMREKIKDLLLGKKKNVEHRTLFPKKPSATENFSNGNTPNGVLQSGTVLNVTPPSGTPLQHETSTNGPPSGTIPGDKISETGTTSNETTQSDNNVISADMDIDDDELAKENDVETMTEAEMKNLARETKKSIEGSESSLKKIEYVILLNKFFLHIFM